MFTEGLAGWNAFWFAPEKSRNLAVARILLAATALWIVLSRRDLPSVLQLPSEMLQFVPFLARVRFGILLPIAVERVLYLLLHIALLTAIVGFHSRISCFVSGILLYHFQPFETLIWTTNPYLRGMTIPTLGLLILSFFPDTDRIRWNGSETFARWPLLLIQTLLAELYFFAGYSKLITSGLQWAGHENLRRWLLLLEQTYGSTSNPIGYRIASSTLLPDGIGWFGVLFELLFPLTLFVKRSRMAFVLLAIMFHIANVFVFHIFFQEMPLLLLFVDWQPRRGSGR